MKIKTPLLIIIILIVILIVLAIIFSIFGLFKKEKFSIPDEILGLSGTIRNIEKNALIIDAVILPKDSAKEPINQKMKVLIDDETKIYKLQFPQAGALKKNDTNGIQPIVIEIKLADLKNGEKINIQTKENISANIKNKTPFIASIIDVAE